MATEIRKVLNLSLGESPKNLRELKSDIYEIKSAIGDMVVAGTTGTTEYDQAVKLLGQDMAVLRQTQNATKSEVAALDGSYNALVQRMRELKTEWRATNNEARRGELTKEITNVNNQLKALDYSVGNFGRNVGNYGNAWESLSGTLNTVQSSGSQFVSGLQAMNGILGLTTAESENLNESLGIMRGVVGVLNSAKGISGLVKSLAAQRAATKAAKAETQAQTAALNAQKTATDKVTVATTAASTATKVFRAVLMSIGIGIVVAALGELAAHLDKVTAWFTKLGEKLGLVNPQTQELKKSNEKLTESIEAQNKVLDKEVELMQAKGEDSQKVIQTQLKVIQAEILEAKAVNEKVKARIDELEVTGKRTRELKKLKEQYEKNNKTIEDLEHKQAVLNAKYDTEERNRAAKAAADRAAAARKAAEDKLKADNEAAEALRKAQEKANELVNKTLEKGMTEREKLVKEHTETLKNLGEAQAHITAESYQTAVDAENAYYAKKLSETISEEYSKAYDKAAQNLENYFKSSKLVKGMSQTITEAFDTGEFYKDKRRLNERVADLRNFYDGLITETVKILKNYQSEMNPLASTALIGLDYDASFQTVHRLYVKYLNDTEQFLKDYGEPFTTAIARIGEEYEAFAQAHSEGLVEVFNRELEAISELANGGSINAAQDAVDRLWLEYAEIFNNIDPSGTLTHSMHQFLLRFQSEMSASLLDVNGANGGSVAEAIRQYYETFLNNLDTQMGEWKQKLNEGLIDAETYNNALLRIEEDRRRITIERDSKMYEARVAMLRQYVSASTNLFDNVASAWEAVIKAKVKNDKMSDESARRSFENMKKLQKATAFINTAAAVAQALSDPAVPTYYLRAINAAAALAAGVAQIAKISATSYDSAGSNSTSTPQLVDRTPVVQTVSLNASEAGEGVAQNMRVYVVESDITEAQNRTRARVSESTF